MMRLQRTKTVNYSTEEVYLEEINWEDNCFRISSPSDNRLKAITESIKSIGLLHRPCLISRDGKYSIVCGFKRLAACNQLKLDSVTAIKLDAKTPLDTCAKIAVADNAFQRPLNLIEQSRSYALIDSICRDKTVFYKTLSETGLCDNPSWVSKVSKLCQLPPSIQSGIEKEAIPIAIAQMFLQMDEATAILLSKLFETLTLGLNKQREIIQLATDIAKRDDISLWDLFHQNELQTIIGDNQLDKNKKAFLMRQWLKFKRYPNLSNELATFDARIRKLKLGTQVKLTPPAYFEGNRYHLSLDFSNIAELVAFRKTIKRIEMDEYLRKIIEK